MKVALKNCGRRFNQDWIFRDVDLTFLPGEKYALLGPNGSGKSTLMSILLGSLSPSEGEIKYYVSDAEIPEAELYRHISFAAPYLDLIEEFTLQETIDFHFKFKEYLPGWGYKEVFDILGLAKSEDKALKYFSSGMKQRTKLALAFCSHSSLLLLDEPTSNLDTQGIDWYLKLAEEFSENKTFIVASNQEQEYNFCKNLIHILTYKPIESS